jgi:hypothetical protein
LLLLVIQFGLATSVLAEPSKLSGEALRQVVSGKAVLIETSIGSFLIRYESDHTMIGQAAAFIASLGTEKDRGQWWGRQRPPLPALVPMAGWMGNTTASGCNALAPPFIGCAMTVCPVRPPFAHPYRGCGEGNSSSRTQWATHDKAHLTPVAHRRVRRPSCWSAAGRSGPSLTRK